MQRVMLLVPCLLMSMTATARAQPTTDAQTKSVAATAAIAIGGTVVPIVVGALFLSSRDNPDAVNDWIAGMLISTGATVGPGLGHVYAHNFKRFPRGYGIRFFGTALLTLGQMLKQPNKQPPESTVLSFGGEILLVGGALLDIIGAPMLVDRQNREGELPGHRRLELSASAAGIQVKLNL